MFKIITKLLASDKRFLIGLILIGCLSSQGCAITELLAWRCSRINLILCWGALISVHETHILRLNGTQNIFRCQIIIHIKRDKVQFKLFINESSTHIFCFILISRVVQFQSLPFVLIQNQKKCYIRVSFESKYLVLHDLNSLCQESIKTSKLQ